MAIPANQTVRPVAAPDRAPRGHVGNRSPRAAVNGLVRDMDFVPVVWRTDRRG